VWGGRWWECVAQRWREGEGAVVEGRALDFRGKVGVRCDAGWGGGAEGMEMGVLPKVTVSMLERWTCARCVRYRTRYTGNGIHYWRMKA